MEVQALISWRESEECASAVDLMGGFFSPGMRWKDYISVMAKCHKKYLNAIRRYVLHNELKYGGDDHQTSEYGVPQFTDGKVASFSYRAWGDLMAAIWSTEENKDYGYMDFYMTCCITKEDSDADL